MAGRERGSQRLRAKKLAVYLPRRAARSDSGTRLVRDSTRQFVPVVDWLGGGGNDPKANAERRAEDLVRGNRGLLSDMHVEAEVGRIRGEPGIQIRTSARVGAIPLRSPVTGRTDFGLVIAPRFAWSGVGDLLATTGFRVMPELLPLSELPQSERNIPPWVLTSVVLERLERLLDATTRRFTTTHADLRAPRGAVDWNAYASQRLPHARALEVPCAFPELRDDEQLRAAVHWAVRRHREALLGAPEGGRIVRVLLGICERLLARLAGTPPRPPDLRTRAGWQRMPFEPKAFTEGVQAIDWTVDERGLAGLSDLSGLAWRLDMEVFFEAWVEALAARAGVTSGAILRSGRREQTRVPLDWSPTGAGSQRSLVPDVVLQREDVVVVLDAKYKRHAQEIERLGWHATSERVRHDHRADVLQALAYSSLFDAPRIVSLLVYPCAVDQWQRLVNRGRALARASVRIASRNLEVGLLAVPLGGDPQAAVELMEQVVRGALP